MEHLIKALALNLPQFHPIPENDRWWGKGFTEWTNVAKAKPLFKNHWQPRLPADLGFYDLRLSEARSAQAQLAKQYGIHGFIYWHYWFAGKQILERPVQEIVNMQSPDFPFCLAWANQSWRGNWHGLSNNKTLIEQTYPGEEDYRHHFYNMLTVFNDDRYITVDGRKLFLIFQPMDIPDNKKLIDCWQNLAQKEGLNGFYFVAMHMHADWDYVTNGYDAIVQALNPWDKYVLPVNQQLFTKIKNKLGLAIEASTGPRQVSYSKFVEDYIQTTTHTKEFPLLFGDWDNTPRSGKDGWLFNDFSLELFEKMCLKVFEETEEKKPAEKFVIIKSWNEWAEGNYLEPDQKHGTAYLETFQKALKKHTAAINRNNELQVA